MERGTTTKLPLPAAKITGSVSRCKNMYDFGETIRKVKAVIGKK
jgi:hypothetical protein